MPDRLQQAIGTAMLLAALPLLVFIAIMIRLESKGPAIYRATRVGAGGIPFTCYKLRTMRTRPKAARGPIVSTSDDRRVTSLGRHLRRMRLDELPQLWNVALGQMRLVGPRPEDPAFIEWSDPLHRTVFSAKPGITGLTQLLFLEEASLLGSMDAEEVYRDEILPLKIRTDSVYLARRSTRLDLLILWETARCLLTGKRESRLSRLIS